MTGTRIRRSRGRDGFTLVEVLITLVVLAVFSLVLTRSVVVSRTGTMATMDYLGAEAVARTLLEGPVPLALRAPGRIEGRLEGHRYRMESRAIEIPLRQRSPEEGPRPPPAFVPLRITIAVSAGASRTVTLETVRLVPQGPET